MANGISGNFTVTTSNPYIAGLIEYSETYDIATAMSSLSVTLKLKRTNSYSGSTTPGAASSFTITVANVSKNITKTAGSLSIPSGGSYVTVFTQTFQSIQHNSDGSCSVNIKISGSMPNCGTAGTINISSQSKTVTLTKIARLSSLSVSEGTLGINQTLTITKQESSYTHTITYSCGSASGTICTKSSSTSITFNPPISLASQNPTGISVSVTYTITTYSGDISLGSQKKTVVYSIPDGSKPSVSISYSDEKGYMSTYGSPIVGLSALKVTLTETEAGGAAIKSRSITVNGETYTASPCLSDTLKTAGTNVITASVTDSRNRMGTASKTFTVLDYSKPIVNSLSVKRCNANGTDNAKGSYLQIKFSGSVTALNNRNHTTWTIFYKKSSESSYSSHTVYSKSTGNYTVTNSSWIMSADTGSVYDVYVQVKDDFNTILRSTSASTAQTIMHFGTNGRTMSVGKISDSTRTDLFDVGWKSKFSGGIEYVELSAGADLNECLSANFYICSAKNCNAITNKPTEVTGTSFRLEVQAIAETMNTDKTNYTAVKQILTLNDDEATMYVRSKKSTSWGSWMKLASIVSGAFVCIRSAESTTAQKTTADNTWEILKLDEKISSRNEDVALRLSSGSDVGKIQCLKNGTVILNGSVRANNGLTAGDMLSVRFVKFSNGSSYASELQGVWDAIEPATNKAITVTTPNLMIDVEANDRIAMQVRTTHSNTTIMGTDSILTIQYL